MINFRKNFIKFGILAPKDFSNIVGDSNGLWRSLIKSGYLNEEGLLQGKFRELPKGAELELEKSYAPQKEKIAEVLRKANAKVVIYEWVESILVALFLAVVIQIFLVQAFKIPSGSMRMTLLEGDRILVSKLRYGPKIPFTHYRLPGLGKPARGDVVVFVYPEDRTKDFIKRLIAFGGETVEIRDGHIYVNGQLVDNPRINSRYYYNCNNTSYSPCPYGQEGLKIKVPQDSYFVLGDNSKSSKDSRYWGFVPKELMIGRAEAVYWPLNRIRVIQ